MAVAGELFAERGYRATTLEDVASALNVKKASLYYHINTKNSLLQVIYERILSQIAEQVLPLGKLDLPADERLRRMVSSHIDFVIAERTLLSVVFQEEWELPEEIKESIREAKHRYEEAFVAVIQQGQESGILRAGSPHFMMRGLLGMTNWLYTWYSPERHDKREVVGEFIQLLERGWLATDAPTQPPWPRADSVEVALEGSFALLDQLQSTMTALSSELTFARSRLEGGLAVSHHGRTNSIDD